MMVECKSDELFAIETNDEVNNNTVNKYSSYHERELEIIRLFVLLY